MRYGTVVYDNDGGFDEKQDATTIFEARALCKVYLKEYEGAAIYSYRKEKFIEYFDGFPIDKIAQEYKGTPIHRATKEYVKKSLLYPVYGYMYTKKMIEKGV